MSYSRSGVPFGLPVEDKSYWGAPVSAGVLVLDQDINLMQRIQDEKIKTFLETVFKDGWQYFGGFHTFSVNTLKINPGSFTLAGKVSQWSGSFTVDNQVTLPDASVGDRTDLIWIEQWTEEIESTDVMYPLGNVDYYTGSEANDIVDPAVGTPCTNRVQVRYRTRVTTGVTALSDPLCTAQGALGSPGAANFAFDSEKNHWVADTGSTSYSLIDGKVYALPICTVFRPGGDNIVYEANVTDVRLTTALKTASFNSDLTNLLIGDQAGVSLGSAVNCTVLGHLAGKNCTSNNNVFMGYRAGYTVTAGINNVFLGTQAGDQATGGYNVFLGNNAGFSNTGSKGICVGQDAGKSATADGGVFIGYHAGENTTTGIGNLFIGHEAGLANITNQNNVYAGDGAGSNIQGNNNTGVGYNSLLGDAGGSSSYENTCIGSETSPIVSTGYRNVFVGYQVGVVLTTGHNNVAVGTQAGVALTGGYSNVLIGSQVAELLSTGIENTIAGTSAGDSLTTGDYNVFMGQTAGHGVVVANYNVHSGYRAGYGMSGNENICLGSNTGFTANATDHNTFVGAEAGARTTSGHNTLLGYGAGKHVNGAYNVYMGFKAGESTLSSPGTGEHNVFIGDYAGQLARSGEKNVCIGHQAGMSISGGDDNVLLGYNAGLTNSGNGNIFIGHNAGTGISVSNHFRVENVNDSYFMYGNLASNVLGIGNPYRAGFCLTVNGSAGPYLDDSFDSASATYRWDNIWATNGVIQTSDLNRKVIHDNKAILGLDFINLLKPIAFTWKNRNTDAEIEHVRYQRQKMEKITETVPTTKIEVRRGKHVKVIGTKKITKDALKYEKVDLFDEQSNLIGMYDKPVMETIEYDKVLTPAQSFKYKRTHYGLGAQDVKLALDTLGIDTKDFGGYIYDEASDSEALRMTEFMAPIIQAIQELSDKVKALEK